MVIYPRNYIIMFACSAACCSITGMHTFAHGSDRVYIGYRGKR